MRHPMMFTKRLFAPRDLFRCSASNVCGLEAARHFRQDGVIIVENFLGSPVLRLLSESCAAAAKARGRQVFPAVDPEHSGALQFDMQVKPKATAKLGELPPPDDLKRVIEDNDAKKALDRHVRKVELKCKTQRKVDRLYRQLSKQRNRWHKLKQIPTVLTEKEELSGDITDERIEEVKKQFTYEQVKSSFEKYRDDGKMELEIRRDNYIDDTLQYLENWGRFWIGFWSQLPLSVREFVGEEVGKTAAFLCGEVAFRLYVDTLQEFIPLTNGVPFHCSAPGLNFSHPNTVNFFLQLQHSSEDSKCSSNKGLSPEVGTNGAFTSSSEDVWTRLIVVPGSHQVIYDITNRGEDFTSLQHQHVLDAGYLMRNTPELQRLPIVEVPRLSPGSALIMSAYLVNSSLPTLQGSLPLTPFCFPTQHTSRHPDLYQLTLMPDHCRFDGLRNSWFSKDTHGPLYHYKEGQLLADEKYKGILSIGTVQFDLPSSITEEMMLVCNEECREISTVHGSVTGKTYSSWRIPKANSKTSSSPAFHSEKWKRNNPVSAYPNPWTSFPLAQPKFRKTHVEWLLHHGHGERLGKYGVSRDLPDFEYADGTPASISPRRYAFKHHLDHLLVQLIRAGATVERYESHQLLPRVPGVKEQRDWDPEIPLFLDDLDERGSAPGLLRRSTEQNSSPASPGGFTKDLVEKRFDNLRNTTTPINVSKPILNHERTERNNREFDEDGENSLSPLEINTMFATYDPKAFVNDDIPKVDRRRPFWSRRRWSLSDNFLLPVSPKPKNTIKDE